MVIAIVVIGAVLRVARWMDNRALWLDEVFLANNLTERSFAGLLRPLDFRQGAPVLFLVLSKGAIAIFGTSERALRLVPLIAGIVSLPLMWAVARRGLAEWAAVVALAMLCVIEPGIYYASECKQYGVDLTVTLALGLAMLRFDERPDDPWRRIALLWVGVIAIFLSHPAVFVIAGMAGVLIVKRRSVAMALMGAVWGIAVAVNYWFFLRPLADDQSLKHHWAEGFMPWSGDAAKWLAEAYASVFGDFATMWLRWPVVAAVAALVGIVGIWRRDRATALMLLMPAVLAMLAATLHRYPFSGRLILFLVPLFIVLVAAGIWVVSRASRVMAIALAAVILLPSIGRSAIYLVKPPGREEILTVMAQMAKWKRPDETLYVYHAADAPFLFYRERVGLGKAEFVHGRRSLEDPAAFEKDLMDLRATGTRTVWVLFSHVWGTARPHSEEEELIARLDEVGERRHQFKATGASVYLYELRSSQSGSSSLRSTKRD